MDLAIEFLGAPVEDPAVIEHVEINAQPSVENLTDEQRYVFDSVIAAIDNRRNPYFFVDAPGGTGKTYLNRLLYTTVVGLGKNVIAVASSGIAATLLPNGKTAHSAFRLPLDIDSNPRSASMVDRESEIGRVLAACDLIIWDEATMAHKNSLGALSDLLRDLKGVNLPFGNTAILLTGDFRQTLPVVKNGNRAQIFGASIKCWRDWTVFRVLRLTRNMRALAANGDPEFADSLIRIGEGRYPVDASGMVDLDEFGSAVATESELISSVYNDLQSRVSDGDGQYFCERGILAVTNATVRRINDRILESLADVCTEAISRDSVLEDCDAANYPVEVLNSLQVPGVPPHVLRLKKGCPVMVLKNINGYSLVNGTRMLLLDVSPNLITAEIINGSNRGEILYLPMMRFEVSNYPIKFLRVQFPVVPSFAMTVNKSQGQTFAQVGLHLVRPVFCHGQLYVALSRVGSSRCLYYCTGGRRTKNVVFTEVL